MYNSFPGGRRVILQRMLQNTLRNRAKLLFWSLQELMIDQIWQKCIISWKLERLTEENIKHLIVVLYFLIMCHKGNTESRFWTSFASCVQHKRKTLFTSKKLSYKADKCNEIISYGAKNIVFLLILFKWIKTYIPNAPYLQRCNAILPEVFFNCMDLSK